MRPASGGFQIKMPLDFCNSRTRQLRECCEHRRYLCRSSYLAMSNAGNETPACFTKFLLGVLYTWLRDAPFRRLET
jgi:hypothetical protein